MMSKDYIQDDVRELVDLAKSAQQERREATDAINNISRVVGFHLEGLLIVIILLLGAILWRVW